MALTLVAALTLSACSSGEDGTDVTIGRGQSQDAVSLEFPIFYVRRPLPADDAGVPLNRDARELQRFNPGAELFMRERASASTREINLTADITEGLGDIRDLSVSFDGRKLLFAMRTPFMDNVDENDLPTWNIWEYDLDQAALRRVIASDQSAEEGHDIMPHYLPDGRIVFSSTRQRQSRAILLDEGKGQFVAQDEDNNEPAFVLHVMNADGSGIRQLSFNQSHDLHPAVLADGRIVFTRWEHHSDDNQFDLYTINPDGSGLQLLYGAHSHDTGTPDPADGQPTTVQFMNPRPMQDGRTLVVLRPFDGTGEGGDLVLIDTNNYVDNSRAASSNAGLAGPAQQRLLSTDVRTIAGPSPGGRFRSAAPLFDGTNRLMVSWSQCRLLEGARIVPCTADRLASPDAVEAPPLYGLFVYDGRDGTQRPIIAPQEGFLFSDVVAGAPRTLPMIRLDRVAGVDFPAEWQAENIGVLHIRSVYDIGGVDVSDAGIAATRDPANPAYTQRPARFLRIEKAVSQPPASLREVPGFAFGPNRALGMREILGYAPIEPDGSVQVKVPANVAFAISIVDAQGQRLTGPLGVRHANWLQLQPGERMQCNGCHNPATDPPQAHGRSGMTLSVNDGALQPGAFANTRASLLANVGETMAQTRNRIMCGGACSLSMELAYRDYWPAAAANATPDIDACYATSPTDVATDPDDPAQRFVCTTGLRTPLPTSQECRDQWDGRCRITVHYEQHIHPLWSLQRLVDTDGDGIADVDGNGQLIDHRCTSCHAPVDAAGAAQVPAGDLDLSDGPSEQQPAQFLAYRELLFPDRGQVLDATGQLVDECLQTQVDPDTQVVTCIAFRELMSPMNAAGARASARFFNTLAGMSDTVDHRDFMSTSELRLLAQWLDIGAQYYNDPFLAPEN